VKKPRDINVEHAYFASFGMYEYEMVAIAITKFLMESNSWSTRFRFNDLKLNEFEEYFEDMVRHGWIHLMHQDHLRGDQFMLGLATVKKIVTCDGKRRL
jgi:hypothetical protein